MYLSENGYLRRTTTLLQSFFLVVWGAQAEDVVTKFANRSKVDKLVVKLEGAMDLVAKEAVKE